MTAGSGASETVFDAIGRHGIVPVVAIDDAAGAERLGAALIDGGLPCAEITFRTHAAADVIGQLTALYPEMLVGAGSVMTSDQARTAFDAGAKFIVSPGSDDSVVDWCLSAGVPVAPGVVTPTEVTRAVRRGLSFLKFFPAEAAGGTATLEALASVFSSVSFMPTGGINPGNLGRYLALPAVAACGGSWMVSRQLIADGAFDRITHLTAEAVAIVRQARSVQ